MPPSASPSSAASRLLLPAIAVGLCYTLIGAASLAFAIPTGFATPIYPAAGVALVGLLVYGPRIAPAVLLAACLVNLLAGVGQVEGWLTGLLSLVIAGGATLQALVSAALVRRTVPQPVTLDSPAAIARFFGFGAALACTVSPSIGVLALGASGLVAPDALLLTWCTWWVGDALGTVIAAPVVLSLIGQPREAWRGRRSSVALPLVLATLLMALAMSQVGHWQTQRGEARFERDAAAVSRSVELRLDGHLDALEAMYGVFIASEQVTADEFRRASAVWLRKLPSVQALGWHEQVARSGVPAFEAAVRADGEPIYRVFERDPTLARTDTDVLAMRYVEPRKGNGSALGVNALSIPAAREAIARARATDVPVASAGFRLQQESGKQLGVVVYRAVRPLQGPSGVVFVTLRMEEALVALLSGTPDYLRVCLIDTAAPPATRLLAGPAACAERSDGPLVHAAALPFAGRAWELRVHAPGGVPMEATGPLAGDGGAAWLFSITGLLATALMGALLLIVTGRTRRTEVAVTERTLQLEHQIAERQVTEQALRESEQRFRSIFNSVPMGVLYTDLRGGIKLPNAGFAAMTGYTEAELLTRDTPSITHPDDVQEDQRVRERLAAGEVPVLRRRKRLITRDGEELWVDATMTLLRDASGAPYRLVALIEDIAEHLRLEEAERARERAEASDRAKSEFLSRMSHELRTPLNAVLGFAQLLELDEAPALDARHADWVGQIRRAGWHLLEMINDVLDLSRIESGTLKLQLESLRLEPLLGESMAMVEAQARERGVHLGRALDHDAPVRVLGDATRIKQILTNLLSNAIKYNRRGGDVTLTTQRLDSTGPAPMVAIEVRDNGLGMTAEQLEQLFQPFNRLGRERSSADGTGIGLVIAKLLAERLGGALEVSSLAGVGSTFRLTLPQSPEGDTVSEIGELSFGDASYHRRQLLYIEDNEINVEVMRGMLAQRPQVELTVASTGLDGLAAVRTLPPDLILLDMHLPDIDGMALLQHLQADESTASIPVVVVSADALPAQISAALKAGATRYLTKPVALEEMLAIIDEQLSQVVTRFG